MDIFTMILIKNCYFVIIVLRATTDPVFILHRNFVCTVCGIFLINSETGLTNKIWLTLLCVKQEPRAKNVI